MRVILIITAVFALASCKWFVDAPPVVSGDGVTKVVTDTAKTEPRKEIRFAGQRATSAERAACEGVGGQVLIGGLRGWENCVRPYADAGKACTDSDECEGRCYAEGEYPGMDEKTDAGRCARNDSPFGCRTEVQNGRAMPTLCVD